jgi:hypothetical protein
MVARGVAAGIASAALTVVMLFIWFRIRSAIIRGSGYTDLPGQDSHQLVLDLDRYSLLV